MTHELISLISKQIQDHGIVVWYDPEGVYQNLVRDLSLHETTILTYSGSFLELRWQLEPFLEFVDEEGKINSNPDVPPKVLIYVPMSPSDTNHALVEVEKAGVVMAPGASPWQRNTRLRVIAERVFKKIAPPEQVKEIVSDVEAGKLALEDLDQLAHADEEISTLKLIFDTTVPKELALKFLCQEEFDPKIAEKDALPELGRLFQSEFGISVSTGGSMEKVRSEFAQSLLLAELAIKVEEGGDATGQLSSIPVPQNQQQRKNLLDLCDTWRNRLDLREKYASFAYAVEKEGGLRALKIDPSSLKEAETFAFVEYALLPWAEDLVLKDNAQDALDIAERRQRTFWLEFEPELQLRWRTVEHSARLLLAAKRVEGELKKVGANSEALIKAYCTGLSLDETEDPFPWYILDRYHRHLEYYFSKIEQPPGKDPSSLERMVFHVRRRYAEVVNRCATALAEALESSGFEVPGVLHQREIFGKFVSPSLDEGKTAYILVDALRYEMGLELIEGLKDEFKVEIKPVVAQLPTITEVGMAVLMPHADEGMELVEVKSGKVGVKVGSTVLKDRKSRVSCFQSLLPDTVVLKLGNIVRPSQKHKEAVKKARMVLVTSQEIDHLGETMEDEDEARRLMEEVRDKLRRGIRQLAALGVKKMTVVADHGHLFLERPDEGMKLDPPGGKTVDLHPRVWIGRGGSDSPGCLRVAARKVGLEGDLELVFPPGIACFKARGPDRGYLHGGISFQELLTPVVLIESIETAEVHEKTSVKVEMTRPKITTRLFTVRVTYKGGGVFDQPVRKVKVMAWANRAQVGEAIAVEYGDPQEIHLERGKPNVVTIQLYEDVKCTRVAIRVLDAKTHVELGVLKDIEVNIAI